MARKLTKQKPYAALQGLLRDVRAIERGQFNSFVSNCLAGRRTPKLEVVGSRVRTSPGQVLRATDRNYTVGACGAWMQTSKGLLETLPREKSQIFVPHWPTKSKLSGQRALSLV